jgi:flagellar biosynthetic protein FlhB
MADEDADESQKTEDPSGRKLGKARDEGNVPMSQEVRNVLMLFGIMIVLAALGTFVSKRLLPILTPYLENAHAIAVDEESIRAMFVDLGVRVGLVLAAPFVVLIIVGVLGTVSQVGWVFSWSKLQPNLSFLNPLAGLKRMFSVMSLLELLKSTIKVALIGLLLWNILVPKRGVLNLVPDLEPLQIMEIIRENVLLLVIYLLVIYTFLASADWWYQRWTYRKKLRMTKQEVKEEHKDTEGDPKVKSRQASLRMQRARTRMLMAVPKATVVVTNPTHYAVALSYEMEEMQAPVVVAKGIDFLALRIRELAETNEVPIVENPPLARALYASVEVDQAISPEHYKPVAEVIGYVMRLKKKL